MTDCGSTQLAEIIPYAKSLINTGQGSSLIPFAPRGTSSVLSTMDSTLQCSVHAADYLPGLVDNTEGLAHAVAAPGPSGAIVLLRVRTYIALW